LIKLIEIVPKNWTRHYYFWNTLFEFAKMGDKQRAYLIKKCSIMKLGDFYLGPKRTLQ